MNLSQEELTIIIDDLVAKNVILTRKIDELVNKIKEKEEPNESI